ncbi:FAD-dependent oxidoreductase [Streptomyces sp. NPDC059761]|uniref:FAD-dependent oxidoreductase n=1 Tax=Streptomyces sp. NPDC059761 TaxID=3346937 RepID=UPI0036601A1E
MARTQDDGCDVAVIGAGAAGLACTSDLAKAGRRVRLVETEDTVGGRIRTDRVAGFTTDRGFQVFNTAYPQVRRRLDLPALLLRPFTAGVLVHTDDGRLRLADPTRRPRDGIALLTGRRVKPRDPLALGVLSARAVLAPASRVRTRPDVTTRTALADAGFSEDFVETFFRPFLSGVFLEDSLETSARFFHLASTRPPTSAGVNSSAGARRTFAHTPPGPQRGRARYELGRLRRRRLHRGTQRHSQASVSASPTGQACPIMGVHRPPKRAPGSERWNSPRSDFSCAMTICAATVTTSVAVGGAGFDLCR